MANVHISSTGMCPGPAPDKDEIEIAKIWISAFLKPRKTINHRIGTSYRLKHVVENWARAIGEQDGKLYDREGNEIENEYYISNGAFIAAMVELGYKYSCRKGNINPNFAVSYSGPRLKDGKIPYHSSEWSSVLDSFSFGSAAQ